MKPPAYVSIILPPFIRLESLNRMARQAIVQTGLLMQRDAVFFTVIPFAESSGDIFSNPSLLEALFRLNEAGIVFSEDHKQGWSPAEFMRELQARGCCRVPFTAIAWRGPGQWFTTVQKPSYPGALGA